LQEKQEEDFCSAYMALNQAAIQLLPAPCQHSLTDLMVLMHALDYMLIQQHPCRMG
jgi:hypothetical protein